MQAALRDFVVHGVITNIDFMQDVLAHADFASGRVTTRWVETQFDRTPSDPVVEALAAAALADFSTPAASNVPASSRGLDPFSPWKGSGGARKP
jgi:acetyl/propionyl-CoA carboxylase alpha subunit